MDVRLLDRHLSARDDLYVRFDACTELEHEDQAMNAKSARATVQVRSRVMTGVLIGTVAITWAIAATLVWLIDPAMAPSPSERQPPAALRPHGFRYPHVLDQRRARQPIGQAGEPRKQTSHDLKESAGKPEHRREAGPTRLQTVICQHRARSPP